MNINKIIKALYSKVRFKPLYYMLSSRDREQVDVAEWLLKQLTTYHGLLHEVLIDNKLVSANGTDITVWNIMRWVHANIEYTRDRVQYNSVEHWAPVNETLGSMAGDCEDGAVLIYCLCRTAGISKEQVALNAGDVTEAGHCWVRYVSEHTPYVQNYLDWCYWYDSRPVRHRTAYIELEDGIVFPVQKSNNYKKLWFTVNEDGGTTW